MKPLPPLDRKLLRDLWHHRGQVAAIATVVACGVAVVVTTRTAYASLLASRAAYYDGRRFADLFAELKRAPDAVAARLAAVPGVAVAEPRVQAEVTLAVPGLAEPATGRLVSLPDGRAPALNDLHLRRGRRPEAGRGEEVVVSEAFAAANGLGIGDTLGAIINGRWQRLRVVGLGISPEYVYEIGGGQLFPDRRRFGVFWMNRSALGAAFDLDGAFNSVSFRLAAGAVEADVIARVNRILEPWGGLEAYGRSEQVSARFLNDEIAQNRVSGTLIPGIFLALAGFLIHLVLTRLVGTEREQIGTLKAFGYRGRTIGAHYLKFALAAVAIGVAGGAGLGVWAAAGVNALYAEYYRFPEFRFQLDWIALLLGAAVTAGAAAVGAAAAVYRVITLPPATAMRPEPPARFRAGALDRLGLARRLAPAGRIVVRNLARRPVRAAMSGLGVAFAVAILITGRFFVDAMRYMATVQFRHVQRENLTIVFNLPRPPRVRHELARLPGVRLAESFRSVAVRVRAGHRSRRVVLLGLEPEGELRRLITSRFTTVPLPPEGVVLTAKLGEILHVVPGDTVLLEILEQNRPLRRVPVAGLVDELLGLSAYMEVGALNRVMREGAVRSGAFLRVDSTETDRLFRRLKGMPAVAGIANRDAALATFETTLAESIGITTSILLGFAGALAVAMVYNTARIAFSERAHELASLRVLGFTRGEVGWILLGEQGVVAALGIAAGLGMGYGSAAALSRVYQWELFRIPLVVSGQTFVYAVLAVVAASILSGFLVYRRLRRLDLVVALKTRE